MAKATISAPAVPEALPGRIIVQFEKPRKATSSGLIFIPETAQKIEKNVGKVIDVGAPTDDQEREFVKAVKRGDKVIANPIYGQHFTVGEGDDATVFHIYRQFEIIGKLPGEHSSSSVSDIEGTA